MPEQNPCINCQTMLVGAYCHNCGQQKAVKRITIKSFVLDFTSKWIGWDNKFLRTVQWLTINPGKVPREYIGGNRVRFVGPLGYTFLTTAIMIIVYSLFSIDVKEMINSGQQAFGGGMAGTSPQDLKIQEINKEILNKMAENFRFMVVTMIPFLALSGHMFYRNKRNRINYLELCVLFFYLAGHTIWFNILSAPLLKYFGTDYFWLISIFSYSYTAWGIISFHRQINFEGIVRAVLSYLVGFLFFVIGIFFFLVFYMFFFTNFVEMVKEGVQGGG